jgi:hypothetical protein
MRVSVMRALTRAACIVICALSFLISVPVVLSGPLRSAYMITVFRKAAWIWPHEYAFIGDSLTLDCPWRWAMGRPLSTVVLAVGGESIREVAKQISLARHVGAKHLFIAAGLNDIILEHEPTEQIARSFDFLLRRIDVGQTALVTLIPYVSDPTLAPSIRAANAIISDMAKRRGFVVIDLNPILASKDNVRRPEMTTDGLHFTSQACAVWMDAVKAQIPQMGARWQALTKFHA